MRKYYDFNIDIELLLRCIIIDRKDYLRKKKRGGEWNRNF